MTQKGKGMSYPLMYSHRTSGRDYTKCSICDDLRSGAIIKSQTTEVRGRKLGVEDGDDEDNGGGFLVT